MGRHKSHALLCERHVAVGAITIHAPGSNEPRRILLCADCMPLVQELLAQRLYPSPKRAHVHHRKRTGQKHITRAEGTKLKALATDILHKYARTTEELAAELHVPRHTAYYIIKTIGAKLHGTKWRIK